MKNTILLTFVLTSICHFQFYSQSNFRKQLEYRKVKLKAEDIKTIEKDGETSWTVKTVVTNRSRDTLFYFMTPNCEASAFSVDTMALFVDIEKCGGGKQTIIAIKPKGQHIVNLAIRAKQPLTSSMKFRIVMFFNRAKNIHDRDTSKRTWVYFSNTIKT